MIHRNFILSSFFQIMYNESTKFCISRFIHDPKMAINYICESMMDKNRAFVRACVLAVMCYYYY